MPNASSERSPRVAPRDFLALPTSAVVSLIEVIEYVRDIGEFGGIRVEGDGP